MQKMQKKMNVKDYETKVPDNIRADNEAKMTSY